MSTGVIQSLTRERGFGFIQCNDSRHIFFHHSKLEDLQFQSLKKGQSVRFKVALTPKGFEAVNVKSAR
jgi:CspA family cold shock protein